MVDDATLLRQYADERSDEAFAELVRRHVDLVYSVALRSVGGDAHLAQDVAQVVFVALARKARALSGRAALGGWLYRSTRFAATDVVRAERRRRNRETEVSSMNDLESTPDPDWERIRPLLDDAIAELPDSDRDAVCLRYFENCCYAEVGRTLGVAENTARMRVERALERLQALLGRRGVTSTIAALALALPGQAAEPVPVGLAAALANGAIGALPATTVAGLSLTFLHLMNTTKIVAGIAAVVSVASIGSALYFHGKARTELATEKEAHVAAMARVTELERQVAEQARSTAAAEAETTSLLAVVDTVAAEGSRTTQAEGGTAITRETVEARYKRAQQLEREGKLEEAFTDYLWCYDVGMVKISSFRAVRSSYVIGAIARLGQRLPAATESLRARRDAAEQALASGSEEFSDAQTVSTLNRALGEDQRTLHLYDDLPADDRRRQMLGRLLFTTLAEAGRYQEALAARPYNEMSGSFERESGRKPAMPNPALADKINAAHRDYIIQSTVVNVGVLAGSGDLEHAADLALRLLDFDNSPATVTLLEKHTSRAGHPGMIAALRAKQPAP